MRNKDPLRLFLPKKETGIDGFVNDIDGAPDDAWHNAVQKYVPEIIWNPKHPDRKTKSTKGGPGSGNHGHQGLSGVHGGSAPTVNKKSASFEPRTTPLSLAMANADDAPKYTPPTNKLMAEGNVPLFDVDEHFDKKRLETLNNQYLREYIEKTLEEDIRPEDYENYRSSIEYVSETIVGLEGTDPVTGYEVRGSYSTDFRPGDDGYASFDIEFDGVILDKNGEQVGRSVIEINVDDYGERRAYIHLLAFHPSAQGGGFGKRYMAHAEDVLFAVGADYIELEAALTVGGYFWARAGYDFKNVRMLPDLKDLVSQEWKLRYNEDMPKKILDNIEHSWDIAALRGPNGDKLGKELMLGTHWHGIKPNPDVGWDTDGYDVGKEYYEG